MLVNRSKLNLIEADFTDTAQGTIMDKLCEAVKDDWHHCTHHPFIEQLANGTLPTKCFQHYLIQLYLFSKHYSRAYALAVVKSEHLDDLREATAHLDLQLNYEMAQHIDYCAQWGISEADLETYEESDANQLYTRYVLDQGMNGDLLDLLVALSPCSIGYSEIGARLIKDPATKLSKNPYRDWIELYGSPEIQDSATTMRHYVQRVATRRGFTHNIQDNYRWASLVKNFRTAIRLEIKFWEMGLQPPR